MRDVGWDREFTCARCGSVKTYEASNYFNDETWMEEWAVVWAAELLPAFRAAHVTLGWPPDDRQCWEVCVDCLTEDEAESLAAYREAQAVTEEPPAA